MSRFGAGAGALGGAFVGGLAGNVVASRNQDYDEPDDDRAYIDLMDRYVGSTVGSLLGATIGAAIGAGSSKPKQVAGVSGVGELGNSMGGGFFP